MLHTYGSNGSQTSGSLDGQSHKAPAPGNPLQAGHRDLPQDETLAALLSAAQMGAAHWSTTTSRGPPPGFSPGLQGAGSSGKPQSLSGVNGWSQANAGPASTHVGNHASSGYPLPNGYPSYEGFQQSDVSTRSSSDSLREGMQTGLPPQNGYHSYMGSSANGHPASRPSTTAAASLRGYPPGMGPNGAATAHSQQHLPQQLLLPSGPIPRRSRSRFQFAQGEPFTGPHLDMDQPVPNGGPGHGNGALGQGYYAQQGPVNRWGYNNGGQASAPDPRLHTLLAGRRTCHQKCICLYCFETLSDFTLSTSPLS